MHNIQYVDTIKIIKYLELLQHVSDHRGSIIREVNKPLGVPSRRREDNIEMNLSTIGTAS